MFRILIQVLIFVALIVVGYEFIGNNKSQSWSYCGQSLKQEKIKMEFEVKRIMRDIGDGAEVTWKEDSRCISASVKNNRNISSYVLKKVKEL